MQKMENVTEKNLDKVLSVLGVDPSCCGYFYIKDAVEILREDKFIKMMALYHLLGKRYDKTPSSIERGMRHAIEKAFNTISPDVIEKLWGNILGMKDKPTVTQFLMVLTVNFDEHYEIFFE